MTRVVAQRMKSYIIIPISPEFYSLSRYIHALFKYKLDNLRYYLVNIKLISDSVLVTVERPAGGGARMPEPFSKRLDSIVDQIPARPWTTRTAMMAEQTIPVNQANERICGIFSQ